MVDNSIAESSEIVCYLQRVGVRHQVAQTKEDAVAYLRGAGLSDDGYDIVLVPDTMPGSLIALNNAIQAEPLNKKVSLILIRNNPADAEQTEVAACQVADIINGPLNAEKVFEALSRAWNLRCTPRKPAPNVPEPTDQTAEKFHILIAEDNPVNQKVARRLLEKLGYLVEVADNGRQAVQKWATGTYDLILMDCQMPDMDGFEATRRIRSDEAGRSHIPIVAVTANAMIGDREKCLASGMDAFVPKPIRMEVLIDTMRQLLEIPAKSPSTIS